MTSLFRLMSSLTTRYPVLPSILTFSLTFPGANLVQQAMFKNDNKNSKNTINLDEVGSNNINWDEVDNSTIKWGEVGKNTINWGEVGRFFVYGGTIHGPVIHNWILFSTRMFPLSTFTHILAKVIMDQLIFAPVILTTFFISHSAMEGRTGEEMMSQWKAKFIPSWATGSSVWPFLIGFCHRFVPLHLRSIYIAVCSFFWFIFLANQKNSEDPWKPPLLRLIQ